MSVSDMILSYAGIAVFAAILDMLSGPNDNGFGFRTVCSIAITLSAFRALEKLING